MKKIKFTILMCLFKLQYIKDEKEDDDEYNNTSGYYITKRAWVWLLLFPFIVLVITIQNIPQLFAVIWQYDACWIGSKKENKMSRKMYVAYFKQLMK